MVLETGTKEFVARLACPDRTHAMLQRINGLLAVTIRCRGGRNCECSDFVYAKESGQVCIHYWYVTDPDQQLFSYFEPLEAHRGVN